MAFAVGAFCFCKLSLPQSPAQSRKGPHNRQAPGDKQLDSNLVLESVTFFPKGSLLKSALQGYTDKRCIIEICFTQFVAVCIFYGNAAVHQQTGVEVKAVPFPQFPAHP